MQGPLSGHVIDPEPLKAYCREVTGQATIVVRAVDTSGNMSAPSNAIPFDC